jgi:AcrR family transcriptional regulator
MQTGDPRHHGDGYSAPPRRTRREEYAELTRRAVVDAARSLFAERGYFATTISDIAELSRVSPGTIYQQCGGKQGLLRTLMDMWTTDPLIKQTLDDIDAAETLEGALRRLTKADFEIYQLFDDIIQTVITTAAHDEEAGSLLMKAEERHRDALLHIATKVRQLGAYPASFSDSDFADLSLYYYGNHSGFHFTVGVLGWPEKRAQEWLYTQFTRALAEATGVNPR